MQFFVPYQAAAWKETVTDALDHPVVMAMEGDSADPVTFPVPSLIANCDLHVEVQFHPWLSKDAAPLEEDQSPAFPEKYSEKSGVAAFATAAAKRKKAQRARVVFIDETPLYFTEITTGFGAAGTETEAIVVVVAPEGPMAVTST